MKIGLAIALIATLAVPALVAAPPARQAVSVTERNRAIMADFVDLLYRQRKVRAAFAAHVAPDYIQHNPRAGDGRDAAVAMLQPLFSTSGARFDVKRVIVDGDLAVVHLLGRPVPSQPAVAVADIYRLQDGRIVEHWDVLQPIVPSTANPHPFF